MKDKVVEAFQFACVNVLEMKKDEINNNIKLYRIMDELDVVDILICMEEKLEMEIDLGFEESMLDLAVEEFVTLVYNKVR